MISCPVSPFLLSWPCMVAFALPVRPFEVLVRFWLARAGFKFLRLDGFLELI